MKKVTASATRNVCIVLMLLVVARSGFAQSQSLVLTATSDGFSDVDTITPNGFTLSSFVVSSVITNSLGQTAVPSQCHYNDSSGANPTTFTYDTTMWPPGSYTIANVLFRPSTGTNVKSNCSNLGGTTYGEIDNTWTVGLTPTTLSNPQSFQAGAVFGGHTVVGDGVADDSAALSSAFSAGDVDVQSGTYAILNTVTVPNGRNLKCESGGALIDQSSGAFTMLAFNGNTSGSVFNCQFRGINYNVNAQPGHQLLQQRFIFIQSSGTSGTTGNITISGNDFNGIGGFDAAVNVYGNNSSQPPPKNVRIAYNTFEHCGYYAVQTTSAINEIIDHNTLNDCAGFGEADASVQQNAGNVFDSNHLTFTYGIGMVYPGCNPGCGHNYLTGGISAQGTAYDYSDNIVTNNIVDGSFASNLSIQAMGGSQNNAVYANNICSGGCTVN